MKRVLTAIAIASAAGCYAQKTPPNILFIMTDQQSVDMIAAHRMSNYISTPNLDRLVNSGYTFTKAYCANPISVPSRYALLTGRSPAQFGVRSNTPDREQQLMDKIISCVRQNAMGSVFRSAGYDTFYGGKIHLPWATNNSYIKGIENYNFELLTFDEREELAQTGARFFAERKGDKPFLLFLSFINPHDICAEVNFLRNNQKRLEEINYEKRKSGDMATLWHYQQLADKQPEGFFSTDQSAPLPQNMAVPNDFPLCAARARDNARCTPEQWRKYIWIYHRLVEHADNEIGKVLNALDKSPYRDNTVVIFTADHGELGGAHKLVCKTILFEECTRIPFVFAGKGIKQGIDSTTMVCNGWDLLPTMCDIAGIEKPKGLEGISLYSQISGGKGTPKRKYLYLESTFGFQIIEDGRYAYSLYDHPQWAHFEVLFDLTNDKGEVNNLVKDPRYQDKLRELRGILEKELALCNITLNKPRNKQTT